jgi:hypothetical protein
MNTDNIDNIQVARAYAHNLSVGRAMLQMLKAARDDVEPEFQKQQDMLDKHMSARIAQAVTGFGA